MPPRDWRLRFKDIEQSIDRIATYIEGVDFEGFSNDRKTVDAVIHNIQIIGEAAIALPESIVRRYPRNTLGKHQSHASYPCARLLRGRS